MNGGIMSEVEVDSMHELREAASLHLKAQIAERESKLDLIVAAAKVAGQRKANGEEGDDVVIGYVNPRDPKLGIYPVKEGSYTTPVHVCLVVQESSEDES